MSKKIRIVFMLFSDHKILNGLLNTLTKLLNILTNPPSVIGAISKANHITGITPIKYNK